MFQSESIRSFKESGVYIVQIVVDFDEAIQLYKWVIDSCNQDQYYQWPEFPKNQLAELLEKEKAYRVFLTSGSSISAQHWFLFLDRTKLLEFKLRASNFSSDIHDLESNYLPRPNILGQSLTTYIQETTNDYR